jgi:hypothetical protein
MALAVAYYTPLGWALEDGEDVDPDDLRECLRAMAPTAALVRAMLADAEARGAAKVRARVEDLMHPERGMGLAASGDGRRWFDEADIRAALTDPEGTTP